MSHDYITLPQSYANMGTKAHHVSDYVGVRPDKLETQKQFFKEESPSQKLSDVIIDNNISSSRTQHEKFIQAGEEMQKKSLMNSWMSKMNFVHTRHLLYLLPFYYRFYWSTGKCKILLNVEKIFVLELDNIPFNSLDFVRYSFQGFITEIFSSKNCHMINHQVKILPDSKNKNIVSVRIEIIY